MAQTSYKWNKNEEAVQTWLDVFTQSGDIILDPFTGEGAVPRACKKQDKHYIAFEVDPEIAERARQNIAEIEYHTMGALF